MEALTGAGEKKPHVRPFRCFLRLFILMRRRGIKVIYSSPHPESQGLAEKADGQIKSKIRAWKAETGLEN